MKWETREISWHGVTQIEAIHCIDFHPLRCCIELATFRIYKIATGSINSSIRIWELKIPAGGKDYLVGVEFLSELRRHDYPVNAIRFSPDGELLASADAENLILLWRKQGNAPDIFSSDDEVPNRETWVVEKSLRGHLSEIFDLSWAPSGQFLLSASYDKTVLVWEVAKGRHIHMIKDFRQYPQGVAWDPQNRFVVSIATDRTMRVYNVGNNFKSLLCVTKMPLPNCRFVNTDEPTVSVRLFYDDSILCTYRRPAFSPDGEILVVPSGCLDSGSNVVSATHVFSRHSLSKPCLILPCREKPTFAVRFCPVYFELKTDAPCLFRLPYRMVFAVLSMDAVFLYDTQHKVPIAYLNKIHFAELTDAAWSSDGLALLVSSKDGYITSILFEPGELGVPLAQRPPIPNPVQQQPPTTPRVDVIAPLSATAPNLNGSPTSAIKTDPKLQISVPVTFDLNTPTGKLYNNLSTAAAAQQLSNAPKLDVIEPLEVDMNVPDAAIEAPLVKAPIAASAKGESSTAGVIVSMSKVDEDSMDVVSDEPTLASATPKQTTPRRVNFVTLQSKQAPNTTGAGVAEHNASENGLVASSTQFTQVVERKPPSTTSSPTNGTAAAADPGRVIKTPKRAMLQRVNM